MQVDVQQKAEFCQSQNIGGEFNQFNLKVFLQTNKKDHEVGKNCYIRFYVGEWADLDHNLNISGVKLTFRLRDWALTELVAIGRFMTA